MIVVAVANQKGGVGKTTTVVNCAAFSGLAARRVLVIDSDPQGNATSVLAGAERSASVYSDGVPTPSTCVGVDLVGADIELLEHEQRLVGEDNGRLELRRRLDAFAERYDLAFIDCPPSLSTLALNAILAAHVLLVPIQCEYYAMEGLGQILSAVDALGSIGHQALPRPLVLLTMHEPLLQLSRSVEAELRRHLGEQVLPTPIPRDPMLAVAPSHGRSILSHDPLSPGGIAYLAATRELLHELERR